MESKRTFTVGHGMHGRDRREIRHKEKIVKQLQRVRLLRLDLLVERVRVRQPRRGAAIVVLLSLVLCRWQRLMSPRTSLAMSMLVGTMMLCM